MAHPGRELCGFSRGRVLGRWLRRKDGKSLTMGLLRGKTAARARTLFTVSAHADGCAVPVPRRRGRGLCCCPPSVRQAVVVPIPDILAKKTHSTRVRKPECAVNNDASVSTRAPALTLLLL